MLAGNATTDGAAVWPGRLTSFLWSRYSLYVYTNNEAVRISMSFRVWLPLLLMLVLAVEGVLGAWASTRMALHVDDPIAGNPVGRAASASCNPAPATSERSASNAGAHAAHGSSALSPADADCSCADSLGCDCLCVFTVYPPATTLWFAGAQPPAAANTPLPSLDLPADRLARVFRPPIA